MSVAGIAATSFFSGAFAPKGHNSIQQAEQEFQQLGKDLRSGSLSAARADFKVLEPELSGGVGAARQPRHGLGAQVGLGGQVGSQDLDGTPGGRPGIAQLLAQLGQSLQLGNVSAAQRSYTSLLQDFRLYGAVPDLGGGPVPVAGGLRVSA